MPVAVFITRLEEAQQLLCWSSHFARASQGKLVFLHTAGDGKKSRVREWKFGAKTAGSLFFEALEGAALGCRDLLDGIELAAAELQGGDPLESLMEAVRSRQVNLLMIARHSGRKSVPEDAIERKLFHRAPCATLQLRAGAETGLQCRKILVAAAGGPHATRALRVAHGVADATGARVTALYVEPNVGEDAESVGARILDKILYKSLGSSAARVEARVVLADDVFQGIRSFAIDEYDLLIVGASKQGLVRRVLFGTVPLKLLRESRGPALAVIREAIPLSNRLRRAIDNWLQSRVPQLDRDQRVSLFERVQSNARWDFDFMALICLSTMIAALGLIRNSAAVVIGAMLVAPLMTPLVGAGLALVQGNTFLARHAVKSVLGGFLLAFGVAWVIGLTVPWSAWLLAPDLSPPAEMLSRGSPGVLDLGVAFISGMAAAYALGRPNLSSALPGVAIAAALIPPIATSGLALAIQELTTALGALLLFLTNIVAIVLGTACSLWAVGLRSGHSHGPAQSWVWRAVLALVLLTAVLAVALTSWEG